MKIKELEKYLSVIENKELEIKIQITDEEKNVSLANTTAIKKKGHNIIIMGECEDYQARL